MVRQFARKARGRNRHVRDVLIAEEGSVKVLIKVIVKMANVTIQNVASHCNCRPGPLAVRCFSCYSFTSLVLQHTHVK
jgi:hypothetical protein